MIKLPFIRTDTIAGKSILAAIRDSVYTMRRVKAKTGQQTGPASSALQGLAFP
ncbi:MAG: hypothetical protein QXI38_04720 [Conexivisphaerales archaeon]